MKNVTISVDEQLLTAVRVEAAKSGKSVSRYISDMLATQIARPVSPAVPDRDAQMEALERILSGPKWHVMRDGRMPTADERNER